MPPLFFVGAIGLMANILAVLSVLIYSGKPPPVWMAWPIPPLMLCFAAGALLRLIRF